MIKFHIWIFVYLFIISRFLIFFSRSFFRLATFLIFFSLGPSFGLQPRYIFSFFYFRFYVLFFANFILFFLLFWLAIKACLTPNILKVLFRLLHFISYISFLTSESLITLFCSFQVLWFSSIIKVGLFMFFIFIFFSYYKFPTFYHL